MLLKYILKNRWVIYFFAVFFGLFSWAVIAAMHSLIFTDVSFLKLFVSEFSLSIILERMLIIIGFSFLGLTIGRSFQKRNLAFLIQSSVYRISESAHSAKDIEDLYECIHDAIGDVMPAKDNFYIALFEPDKKIIHFDYFKDVHEKNPGPQKFGRGLTDYVFRTGAPLLASPKVFEELVHTGEVESVGPPSIDWLGIPLKIKNITIGVLAVQSYTKGLRYSNEDKKILTYFSEQIAMAIDRMKSQEALKESEGLFRSVVENSHDGISILDDNFRIEYVNDRVIPIMGYYPKEMIGEDFRKFIALEDMDLVIDLYSRRQKGEDVPPRYELRLKHKDGRTIHVEVSSNVISDNAGKRRTVTHIKDISDRKIADDKIKASLKEKEMLLREVHHRVKNNMQIISSLLNLQSKHIKDASVQEIFLLGQNRVRSMALVHEKLYQSEDLAKVDFNDYIQSLSNYLFQVYGVDESNIRLDIDIKDFFLDINTAVPCGLLVNEIIANSLKHAFPEGKKGEIKVQIEPVDTASFKLLISDNGIGLPADIKIHATDTLGLQLVQMLVEQLNGDCKVEREKGTAFKIHIHRQDQ